MAVEMKGRLIMGTELQGSSLGLPTGYYLERDPDLLILRRLDGAMVGAFSARGVAPDALQRTLKHRSDTSELQSRQYLVCRLLLEKKKLYIITYTASLSSSLY